jgi:hypothetical protein
MIDAFNSGWIDFPASGTEHHQGKTELKEVIKTLVAKN